MKIRSVLPTEKTKAVRRQTDSGHYTIRGDKVTANNSGEYIDKFTVAELRTAYAKGKMSSAEYRAEMKEDGMTDQQIDKDPEWIVDYDGDYFVLTGSDVEHHFLTKDFS